MSQVLLFLGLNSTLFWSDSNSFADESVSILGLSLVLCGELHDLEMEFLVPFRAPSTSQRANLQSQSNQEKAGDEAEQLSIPAPDDNSAFNSAAAEAEAPVVDSQLSASSLVDTPSSLHIPDDEDLFLLCGIKSSEFSNGIAIVSDDEEGQESE